MRRHIDEFIIDTPVSEGRRASTHSACLAHHGAEVLP
jgi:hypothetical protein